MALSGPDFKAVRDGLVDAFPDWNRLRELTRFGMDIELGRISAPAKDLDSVAYDLVVDAEAKGELSRLLAQARLLRPNNPVLYDAVRRVGLGSARVDGATLEGWVNKSNRFKDVRRWISRLAALEGRVCRVEAGAKFGTGFLIAADLVLTNYHVVAGGNPAATACRFDYLRASDGTESPGVVVRLAADGFVASAPYDPVDLQADPKPDPQPMNLDYAILRLSDPIGGRPRQPDAALPDEPRKWIPAPDPALPVPAPGDPMFILQHPAADFLQLATDVAIGVNANGTRLRYKVNTVGGSSGSPVFNSDWDLVALHHAGDPAAQMGTYNEGIPIAAILADLASRGLPDLWAR